MVWYTNTPILFLCALFLHLRGKARYFPYFVVYLLFIGAKSYAMIPVSKIWGFSSWPYFYGSYGGTFVGIGLTFVILYEVVRSVLTSGALKVGRLSFILLSAALSIAAGVLSLVIKVPERDPLFHVILAVTNVVRLEQLAVLLILGIVTVFFGFYWGDLAFGIAAGFAFYAVMDLMSIHVRTHIGPTASHNSNLIDNWSYEVASLIWLFYILKKPKSLPAEALPPDDLSDFSGALEEIVK